MFCALEALQSNPAGWRGGTCLWFQALGKARWEDHLSPGVKASLSNMVRTCYKRKKSLMISILQFQSESENYQHGDKVPAALSVDRHPSGGRLYLGRARGAQGRLVFHRAKQHQKSSNKWCDVVITAEGAVQRPCPGEWFMFCIFLFPSHLKHRGTRELIFVENFYQGLSITFYVLYS